MTSRDGTEIPYCKVTPKELKLDGGALTLLDGCDGFEISETPR
jgi:prolyl oligopeptidase PreP (S9A serine peptidase family)